MKKNSRKLTLNRETLLRLESTGLRLAVAGAGTDIDCPYHQDTTGGGTGPIWTGPFYGGCPSYSGNGGCTVSCGSC